MAHEAYRIYGWNNGSEPERYRLHVQDYQPAYATPENTYGYYGSSPGADYIDRSRYPRTEDHIAPHVESGRRSRRRKNEYHSNSDYIAPPTDSREDYISQAYDTPPSRNRYHEEVERRMPGGFYDSNDRPVRSGRSANFHEDENVNRIIKNADFSSEHEVMRAYWVPGPQDYDEMDVSGATGPRNSRPRSREKSKSKVKRVTYESDVDSESDIKTYVDDSGDEGGKQRVVYDSDEDEDMVSENPRVRSRSRRTEVAGNRWEQSSRMPGGYASSSPSPSIHYLSDDDSIHTPYQHISRSRVSSRHRSPIATRYASSSPGMRSHSRSRSRNQSSSRPRYAPSPPTLSDYGPHQPPSRHRHASSSPPRPRPHPRIRNPRAPSPPTLTQRFSSSTSSPSVYVDNSDSEAEADVRYASDSGDSSVIPCRGVRGVKGRYVGSDEESDFVINGGSECDFEGDDIWCDSSEDGLVEYDDQE